MPTALVTSPVRQLALQAAALLLVLSLAWPFHVVTATPLDWRLTALAVGGAAFVMSALSRQPWWWRTIHLVFAPLAWAVAQLAIDPGWFLLAFFVLLLAYRGALSGQVPLYFSGDAAVEAIAELIEERRIRRFLDLGGGIGSIVVPLARRFPEVRFVAVENSVLPWLFGWLRTRGLRNCEWRWQDLWATELRPFDLVYAFLSPAPMPRLGTRVALDMRPDSLFLSNSFEIPGRAPSFVTMAGERPLYGYVAGEAPGPDIS